MEVRRGPQRTLELMGWALLAAACPGQGCSPPPAADVHHRGLGRDAARLPAALVTRLGLAVAPAQRVQLVVPLRTSGTIVLREDRVARVSSPVGGLVVGMDAALGEQVAAGATLAHLFSQDVGEAAGDLVRARAEVRAAEAHLQRAHGLRDAHAAAERAVDAAVDRAGIARAEARRAALVADAFAADAQGLFRLRSPIAGEVIERGALLGSVVQGAYKGGRAAPLYVIADLTALWARLDVHEADVDRVAVGQRVRLAPLAGEAFVDAGEVGWTSRILDEATRCAEARVAVDNRAGSWRANTPVRALVYGPPVEHLAVPRRAVVILAGQAVVYQRLEVDGDGGWAVARRVVHLGPESEGPWQAISAGLDDDAPVVVGAEVAWSRTIERSLP